MAVLALPAMRDSGHARMATARSLLCASLVLFGACGSGQPAVQGQVATAQDASTDVSPFVTNGAAADAVAPAAAATCTVAPTAVWHALAAGQPFRLLARQPQGPLIAAGWAGWQRLAVADGKSLGSWAAPAQTWEQYAQTGLATDGTGAFLLTRAQAAWGFSADGAALWTKTGVVDWQVALGMADGFVLAGTEGNFEAKTVTVARVAKNGDTLWTVAVPPDSLDGFLGLALAQTATGTVLVAGTRWPDGSQSTIRPRIHTIDSTGHIDAGANLLDAPVFVLAMDAWLPDGRLLMRLGPSEPYECHGTRLYAWQPGKLEDLGLQTAPVHCPGMSYVADTTTGATILPGRLAWIQYQYCSDGACDVPCPSFPGRLGVAAWPLLGAPAEFELAPPAACAPTKSGCPAHVAPMAIVALPDGGLATAGWAEACQTASADTSKGKPPTGWVARWAPLCGP